MIDTEFVFGSTNQSCCVGDLIMDLTEKVATGTTKAHEIVNFIHDPKPIYAQLNASAAEAVSTDIVVACNQRNTILAKIAENYIFPLHAEVRNAYCLPTIVIEDTSIENQSEFTKTYAIMRTIDIIDRQYLTIDLPELDFTKPEYHPTTGKAGDMSQVPITGCWAHGLINRIVKSVSLHARQNTFTIYEYSGEHIELHKMLFNPVCDPMTDVALGEDTFRIRYDPFHVPFGCEAPLPTDNPATVAEANGAGKSDCTAAFTEEMFYNGSYYGTPLISTTNVTPSIHRYAFKHGAKRLMIPLEILGLANGQGQFFCTKSLATNVGFIKIAINENWLTRSLIINRGDVVACKCGFSHDTRCGKTDEYYMKPAVGAIHQDPACPFYGMFATTENIVQEVGVSADGSAAPTNTAGTMTSAGGIATSTGKSVTVVDTNDADAIISESTGVTATGSIAQIGASYGQVISSSSTSATPGDAMNRLSCCDSQNYPEIYNDLRTKINFGLVHSGYVVSDVFAQLIARYPAMYHVTEWTQFSDVDFNSVSTFEIKSEMYCQALVIKYLPPKTAGGIETDELYPFQMLDPSCPPESGYTLTSSQNQGPTNYTWDMIHTINPQERHHMRPLPNNVAVITFGDKIDAYGFPSAYIDFTYVGTMNLNVRHNPNTSVCKNLGKYTNVRNGITRIYQVGVNALLIYSLSLQKLVY